MWRKRVVAWMMGNNRIKIGDLVVSKIQNPEWCIGKVIGMSRFDIVEIGPLLNIRDITTGKLVERFPLHVDRLKREKATWRQMAWVWGSKIRHEWWMRICG